MAEVTSVLETRLAVQSNRGRHFWGLAVGEDSLPYLNEDVRNSAKVHDTCRQHHSLAHGRIECGGNETQPFISMWSVMRSSNHR